MQQLEAKIDFDEAIKEIHILIESAINTESEKIKYATYNKAAIVLLCGKFESFLESFLEEYAYEQLKISTNKTLNGNIFDHLVDNLLVELENAKLNKIKRKTTLDNLTKLYGESEIDCLEYKVVAKFSYGKHGQKEVSKLLNCFGFENYLNSEKTQTFFTSFNSLNNIRNNILHQDSTPSLTHKDVDSYLEIISTFVNEIHNEAQEYLIKK